jgi:hypothetical protein
VEADGDEDAMVKATNSFHGNDRARDDWGANSGTHPDSDGPYMVERDVYILWHDLRRRDMPVWLSVGGSSLYAESTACCVGNENSKEMAGRTSAHIRYLLFRAM